MGVTQIETKEAFDDMLTEAGQKLVVVDFYADWCGPCRQIAPKLKKIAEEDSSIVVAKVNVDETDDVVSVYGVESLPTFVLIKAKCEVTRVIGASEAKLKAEINKHK